MRYRAFKVSGQITDRVDGSESGVFGDPDEVAAAEVAVLAGVSVGAVEVFFADDVSPYAKRELTLPPQTFEPQPPTLEEKVDALLAASPAIAATLGIAIVDKGLADKAG